MTQRSLLEISLTKIILRNDLPKFKKKIEETKKDLNQVQINAEEEISLLHFLGMTQISITFSHP
jgi:hypothetical protein